MHTEPRHLRKVQRSFTATISFCGRILVSWGLRINRCHPRFHTMKRSLPGLIVQRSRVFVPIFWDSVSYCTKLLRTRLGVQAYAPCSCHSRCTKLPWGTRPKSFSASASSCTRPFGMAWQKSTSGQCRHQSLDTRLRERIKTRFFSDFTGDTFGH